jgi:hypothetical protein
MLRQLVVAAALATSAVSPAVAIPAPPTANSTCGPDSPSTIPDCDRRDMGGCGNACCVAEVNITGAQSTGDAYTGLREWLQGGGDDGSFGIAPARTLPATIQAMIYVSTALRGTSFCRAATPPRVATLIPSTLISRSRAVKAGQSRCVQPVSRIYTALWVTTDKTSRRWLTWWPSCSHSFRGRIS